MGQTQSRRGPIARSSTWPRSCGALRAGEKVLIAMWTAAFDASGHGHDQDCLSVAGFIAYADRWDDFVPEWHQRLLPLRYWHTTEHKKRTDIRSRLVDMIPDFAVAKFGSAIRFDTFAQLPNPPKPAANRLNALALCGSQCVEKVYSWARSQGVPLDRVAFVFGEGDYEKDVLVNVLNASGYQTPDFRYDRDGVIKGIPHKGFIPLQASDLLVGSGNSGR